MTKEKAREVLGDVRAYLASRASLKNEMFAGHTFIDICNAIKALEHESDWVPVSERLPEEDTEVIVLCTDDSGDSEFSYTTTGWHFKGVWVVGNERSYFVTAWMSLPEPYKAESKDKE